MKNKCSKVLYPDKKRYKTIIFFVLLCIGTSLPYLVNASNPQPQSPSYPVSGTVSDSKGAPLPGVTVRLDETSIGVATDQDGNFTIRLPKAKGILVFSFVGYQTAKVPYISGTPVKVRMQENVTQLDEVHAIGYGTRTRRREVGAVSTVKAKDFEGIPSASVSNLIQARVPGLRAVNESGAPGGAPKIVIRGYNSMSVQTGVRGSDPLWVIDGVPAHSFTSSLTGQNTLSDIDPNDIESIEVLKDAASASIYGSRASNGVILVTTKKGKLNEKAKLSLNVSHSFSFAPAMPAQTGGNAERRLRLCALQNYQTPYYDYESGTYKYPADYKEAYDNFAALDFWSVDGAPTIEALQDSLNPFYNQSTDWYKIYFRRNPARVTNANVQFTGGSEKMAYSVGLGYYDETGVLKHTGYNRLKFSSNLLFRPISKLEGNARFYISRSQKKRATQGSDVFNFQPSGEIEILPVELTQELSSLLPYKPVANQRFNDSQEKNFSYRLQASFDLCYEFIPGLKLKSSLSTDYNEQRIKNFYPSHLNDYGDNFSSAQVGSNLMWLNENLLTYKKTFRELHNLDLLAGLSFQSDESETLQGWAYRTPSDAITDIPGGNAYDKTDQRQLKELKTNTEKQTMIGMFFRATYDYGNKYIFDFTLRRDGSSTFGRDHRWGTFPSYAIGYVLSEEGYMDWARGTLDFAKIRVSYGKSGNKFHYPYLAQGSIQAGLVNFLDYTTLTPEWNYGLYNPNLTWEETKQLDAGLDISLFNYRLNVNLDYYRRNTDKLLSRMQLPGNTHGYTGQWQNHYGIRNEGIEFEVSADLIRTEKLQWKVSVNFAHNWNKLVKSDNGRDFINVNYPNNISVLGKPLNGILAYQNNGFYDSQDQVPYMWIDGIKQYLGVFGEYYRPGDRIITDVNHDGEIYSDPPLKDDRYYCGTPLPVAQGGIITNLRWKGFDLNVLFNYSIGQHILNAGSNMSVGTIASQNEKDILKPVFADLSGITFWEKPGDNADFPYNRPERQLINFNTFLTGNIEKVHYLKLKTFTLGYTFPEHLSKLLHCSVRVFMSGENLFTLTNYSGIDPETVDIISGIDYGNTLPLAKKITIGLTLNF